MEIYKKHLIYFFFILLIVKTIFVLQVGAPSIYSDEYLYIKTALHFFQGYGFMYGGEPTSLYPPLYSFFISISYFYNDGLTVYHLMQFLNIILSSLIIIPAYLLSKEFF